MRVSEGRVNKIILQGVLYRVKNRLQQLDRIIDEKFLLLRFGRAGHNRGAFGKGHACAALAAGDRFGKVQIPAGQRGNLCNQPFRGDFLGGGDGVFLKLAVPPDIQGGRICLGVRAARSAEWAARSAEWAVQSVEWAARWAARQGLGRCQQRGSPGNPSQALSAGTRHRQ